MSLLISYYYYSAIFIDIAYLEYFPHGRIVKDIVLWRSHLYSTLQTTILVSYPKRLLFGYSDVIWTVV